MSKGLGNDIIEIERIERIISRYGQRFIDKLFTAAEQAYCLGRAHASRHFAGRFAAKEAISKALGTGFGKDLAWLDIEITNNQNGKPVVALSASAAKHFGNPQILLSISHCHSYATAVALVHDD